MLINNCLKMIEFKRSNKSRMKKQLFNPYKNGISSYDMAYLSSKRVLNSKALSIKRDSHKDFTAA